MHAMAATRWLAHSVDAIPRRPSEEGRTGDPSEPELAGGRIVGTNRLASSRPADWRVGIWLDAFGVSVEPCP